MPQMFSQFMNLPPIVTAPLQVVVLRATTLLLNQVHHAQMGAKNYTTWDQFFSQILAGTYTSSMCHFFLENTKFRVLLQMKLQLLLATLTVRDLKKI